MEIHTFHISHTHFDPLGISISLLWNCAFFAGGEQTHFVARYCARPGLHGGVNAETHLTHLAGAALMFVTAALFLPFPQPRKGLCHHRATPITPPTHTHTAQNNIATMYTEEGGRGFGGRGGQKTHSVFELKQQTQHSFFLHVICHQSQMGPLCSAKGRSAATSGLGGGLAGEGLHIEEDRRRRRKAKEKHRHGRTKV